MLRAPRRLQRHDRSRAHHAGPEEGEPSHQQGERLELPPLCFVHNDDSEDTIKAGHVAPVPKKMSPRTIKCERIELPSLRFVRGDDLKTLSGAARALRR